MRIFAKNRFITTFEKTTEVKNLLLTQTVIVGWKLLDYIDIIDIMATLEQFSGKYGILYLLLTFTAIILQVFLFSNITQAKTVTLYLSFDFVYVKSLRLGLLCERPNIHISIYTMRFLYWVSRIL